MRPDLFAVILVSKRLKPVPTQLLFLTLRCDNYTSVSVFYAFMSRLSRQTGRTGVQSHDPALTWMKEMVTLLETKQGKGESEGLAGQPLTMGPCSKTAGHTKARETPSFPLPHCNRAGISHWPVNSHSVKLLFNLTPGLHRNQDESGRMYLGNWPLSRQPVFTSVNIIFIVFFKCKMFPIL